VAGRALPGQDSPRPVVQTFRRKEPDPTGQATIIMVDGRIFHTPAPCGIPWASFTTMPAHLVSWMVMQNARNGMTSGRLSTVPVEEKLRPRLLARDRSSTHLTLTWSGLTHTTRATNMLLSNHVVCGLSVRGTPPCGNPMMHSHSECRENDYSCDRLPSLSNDFYNSADDERKKSNENKSFYSN